MTRTSKYLNQDTITALQSFQIEKIDREITDYLDTNNKMNTYHFEYCPKCGCYHPLLLRVVLPTLVSKCFVVKNVENVLLWTVVNLLFILTKTNPNGMNLSWIH
ncbi:MAG: hypothetical protein ACI317_08445 [Floccifex porci]